MSDTVIEIDENSKNNMSEKPQAQQKPKSGKQKQPPPTPKIAPAADLLPMKTAVFADVVMQQMATGESLSMPDGKATRSLRQATVQKLQQKMGNQFIDGQIQRQPDAGVGLPAGVPEMPNAVAETPDAFAAPVIPDELLTNIDVSSASDDVLRYRLYMIESTLEQFMQSTPETVPLEEQATQISRVLAERQVEEQVRSEIEGILNEFSHITVTVRWGEEADAMSIAHSEEVAVHPPYFMNVNDRNEALPDTLQRYDTAVAHRNAANRATRNLLNEISRSEGRGGMGLGRAKVGKSHPEDIQRILQTALDQNLIHPAGGRNRPNGDDLRNWLVRYGIGIECSGFVSQALNRVTENVQEAPLAANEQINRGSSGLRGGAAGFVPIADPSQLQAGDTMQIPGHVRIITHVRSEGDDTVFTTAESRSGGGGADVGPDTAEWRYHNNQLQVRRIGEIWRNADEDPTFGRYTRLQNARNQAVVRGTQ